MFKGVTPRLLFCLFSIGIGSPFMYGYNLGIINAPQTVMGVWIRDVKCGRINGSTANATDESEKRQWCSTLNEKEEDKMFDTNSELSVIWAVTASIFCLGGLLSAFFSYTVVERYGPKPTLFYNNIIGILAAIIMGLSYEANSFEMLIVGRLVAGVNAGITSAVAPMYMTEIPPTNIRGVFGASYECFHVSAIFISEIIGGTYALGTKEWWPILFYLGIVPCVLQMITLPFCAESPKYLMLVKQKPEKAKDELEKLRGPNSHDEEWEEMQKQSEKLEGKEMKSMFGLVKDKFLRRAVLIAMIIISSSQLSGHDTVIYYSTEIFKAAGLQSHKAELATLGVGGTLLAATVGTALFVDRMGRRMLLLVGLATMCAVTCVMTVFMVLFETSQSESDNGGSGYEWTPYASMVCVFLHIITFAIGPGTIPPFVIDEMFTEDARPAAASAALAVNWCSELLVVVTFPLLQAAIGAYTFIIYAGLLLFYFIYTLFKLPETKEKEPDDIADELKHKEDQHVGG